MERRTFLSLAVAGASAALPPADEYGYAAWSWQRWREITGESRPRLTTDQTGKAELADLLVHNGRPVKSATQWEARRESLRNTISAILGTPPAAKPLLAPKVTEETKLDTHVLRKLSFQAEPGEHVPAYLLVPKQVRGRLPAVVCPHQTVQEGKREPAGLAGNPSLHMALHLVRRGYVTFTYDALCFGERHDPSSGHYGDAIPFYRKHPAWSLMSKMAWDLSRGIDYLETLDFVDPRRIGSIGHSHGAYTTLWAMALDPRIAAGVSSCGFDTFRIDGNVFRWSHATALLPRMGFYLSSPYIKMSFYRAVPDSEVVETPFDLHAMAALIAPRPLWLSVSDDDWVFPNSGWSARQGLARLEPLYRLLSTQDRLGSYFFRGGHSFPPEAAGRAYGWLDRWLKG